MKHHLNLLLLSFLLCFCASHIVAQSKLHERRIYLFDVTKSMVGQGVVQTPVIFNEVRQNLIDAVDEIEDPLTEIIIIPFTDKPHSIIKGCISQKDSLKREIGKINVRSGDTNISSAWETGVSFLDSTKVNYLFLLTDGLHNNGPSIDELYAQLNRWNDLRRNHYYFAFYVMLTENAVEQNIRNITQNTPQMWSIQTLNIKAALIRTSLAQRSNIFENKTIRVQFVSNNSKVFLDDLDVRFSLQENPYYEVLDTKQDTNVSSIYEFEIKEKIEKISIPTEATLTLHINHNQDKYPLVFFTPEDIDFRIIYRGVRKMTFIAVK